LLSTQLAGLLISGIDERAIKKLTLLLIKEIILYVVRDKLMTEFKKRNLDVVYQEEIKEWLDYLDQQEFGRELEKKMLIEIKRFIAGRKTIEEIVEEAFNKPEWIIEFVEYIPANYVFKSILGYA